MYESIKTRQVEEQTVLLRLSQALLGASDTQTVMDQAVRVTAEAFNVEFTALALVEDGGQSHSLRAGIGWSPEVLQQAQGVPLEDDTPLGHVIHARTPVIIPDSWPKKRFGESLPLGKEPPWMTQMGVTSALLVPMLVAEQPLGGLVVASEVTRDWDGDDIRLLSLIANATAQALERARLFERTDARLLQTNQRLMLINRIARRLSSILDVDQLLAEVVELVKDNLGCYCVGIGLVERDEIAFRASSGSDQFVPPRIRLKFGALSMAGWVVTHGQALIVPDVTQDARYYQHPRLPDTRSAMAMPIQVDGRILGVINVESDQLAAFDQDDLNLLRAIADQLALALENARAYQDARAQRDEAKAVSEILFQQTDEMVAINRVVTALLDVTEEGAAAVALVNGLRDELGVQVGMLWLADRSGQELQLAAAVGVDSEEAQVSQCAHCPVLNQVWHTGQRASREYFEDSVRCTVSIDDRLMLPIEANNEKLGVLVTDRKAVEEDTLRILANQAALGLAAARSYGRLHDQAKVLEQTNAELVRATQAKTDFLNRVSHEMRTPLTSIIGFSELLLMGRAGPINEKQTRYARNILESGRHQLALVNDLLDLAKIEAGKMELHPEQVAVTVLLDTVATMMATHAVEKGLRLETDLSDLQLTVVGDMTRLREILLNLVSNAIKFTPEGGSIKMRAELMSDSGDESEQPAAVISVADTGIGIKEENFSKVFALFEQVESPLTRAQEGTGLGLALTKHLVELHGGRIWFESTYGEGTTFFVALPIECEG